MSKNVVASALVLVFLGYWTDLLPAQQVRESEEVVRKVEEEDDLVYQQSYNYRPDPKTIIFQKAQARAQQRMARMASMRWYGMYNERPTASPTPFTSMYSPAWQMPGGRPYAWYTRGWSTVVVVGR